MMDPEHEKRLKQSAGGDSAAASGGVSGGAVALVVAFVLAVWFILVNTDKVSVRFWIPEYDAPLWLVILVALALGAVIGHFAMWARRRNRRAERKE